MTNREFKYKELTENQINSGQFVFFFEPPTGDSWLSTFAIFLNGEIVFSSEYIITEELKIRIKTISNKKVFRLINDDLKNHVTVHTTSGQLLLNTQDFLYLISNQQWVVEDIALEN